MSKDTGGPAFPAEGGCDSGLHAAPGMTLRDFFAAHAIVQARTTMPVWELDALFGKGCIGIYRAEIVAADAYAIADAMLAERAKGGAK